MKMLLIFLTPFSTHDIKIKYLFSYNLPPTLANDT